MTDYEMVRITVFSRAYSTWQNSDIAYLMGVLWVMTCILAHGQGDKFIGNLAGAIAVLHCVGSLILRYKESLLRKRLEEITK